MAEAILFHVAGEILNKLGSQASTRLEMVCGVKDDLTKLTSAISTIKDVLLDAEERPTKTLSLQNWLLKLEEALYEAEDVLDEVSSEALRREVMTRDKNAKQVRIFFSRSNQIAFNYRIALQVKKVRERLDAIAVERKQFHLRENYERMTQYGLFDQIRTGRETWSLPNKEEVIGRDDDKKKVKDLLLDMNMNVTHNVSFIAIAGMGGIGKTTLAKSLYNDQEVSDYFDSKIWVWVSDQFEVKVVVKKIIESATKSNPNVEGMEALQTELQKVIGGKKYLLVMDDVWNESEEKWYELKSLLMDGARGSKILITKRDSKVATEIKSMTSLLITLEGLPESNSWSLFKNVAFKEGKEPANRNLIKLGKDILLKCGGVPLVIIHIGRLLYAKNSEEEWMSFEKNELLKVIEQDNYMTSILKSSYNHLPPNLKQCFAYFSLFPKWESVKINDLIRQWMAHGFIESSNGSKSMKDTGMDYFKELCWRFFFENSSDECNFNDDVRMHDVMRDVATNVAGKKYVRGNSNCDNYVLSEKTRHVSFDNQIEAWQDLVSKLSEAKGLRTFQLFSDVQYEKKNEINEAILDKLFSSFPRLRVLVLKKSKIHMVPNSIKRLRHLRYLDLSTNKMKSLPKSITELQNLQTLNLTNCFRLEELPKGMEKLSCLQTVSYYAWDCKKFNMLSKWSVMNPSDGMLKIIGLEKLRHASSKVCLVNLKDKEDLRDLKLEWKLSQDKYKGEDDETVMENLQPHPNVKFLQICGYNGVGLPNWVSLSANLINIEISNCHRLQHLPQLGRLPALQNLHLWGMRSLKFIDKNKPCSWSFPSLHDLILENMPNLEGWWESRVGDETLPIFPQLSVLTIRRCPKLNSMPKLASIGVYVTLCDVGAQLVSTIGPLSRLKNLSLEEIKDLKYLEMESQQNLASSPSDIPVPHMSMSPPIQFQYLFIYKCSNLMSLPEWIGTLTSLMSLWIVECPKLKSIPEGMRQLTSLNYLRIGGCPELEERCKQGGEDWPKIAHIPNTSIG